MKLKLVMAVCMIFTAGVVFAEAKLELKTQKDKLSYAVGVDMGNSLKRNAVDVDSDIVARGIKDTLTEGKPLMTEQEVRAAIVVAQKDMQAKRDEKNKAYLAENKKKKGVKVLPSGLQYRVISQGKGKTPKAADTVTVHYKGMLADGTEFDSSYKRGQPATFPVNGVIKGWTEALQLMKEGSKWELVIPADLAYGEQGRPGIPPGSTLIFEVELISVKE
jgi:FKBP-type peptidyl-prolyl cis-trans isomerase FklB